MPRIDPSGPLEPVTCKFPKAFVTAVDDMAEGGNRSKAVRTLAEYGLRLLQDPSALAALDLEGQVHNLAGVLDQWRGVVAPKLICPSGAAWVDGLEAVDAALAGGHAVITGPGFVVIQGTDSQGHRGVVTFDLSDGGRFTIHTSAGDATESLDGPHLASMADALAAGVADVRRRAAEGDISGLEISSTLGQLSWFLAGPSGAGLQLRDLRVNWSAALTYTALAELFSLQARWLAAKVEQIGGLNASLQASPVAEPAEVAQ